MINLPYNAPLMSQMMPTQNVPVQTSHNNFQPFLQPQTNTQQMQTNPAYPINPQDPYKSPFYQLHQSDMFMANQSIPIALQPRMYPPPSQPFNNVPPPQQTQSTYSPMLQNVLEQIRGQVSSATPIFILPGGCQQSTNHHQQAVAPSQGGGPQATGQPTSFNYPPPVHCPPPFYPYPIPLPVYEPFVGQTRNKDSSGGCGCCHRRQESVNSKNHSLNCCCNLSEQEDHRCTATNDDTICSKRNCPASVSLQALASQFLSLSGIVSCAATRLILRKVPGSNITNTMEDTMDKAQKAIGTLTKEQLLMESRNAQQVNALINLHMTTNPPANIIPLLTLLQLKVNVMKAQIESLINKKVMECQGFGYEVETSGPIDPTVLTMKTNEELRHLLSALRQKECDERMNVNFSPYHSQRVIAESRLNNVQAKIRQVEAEFDRRRSVSIPAPSLTSRVIQQFAGSSCTFGFAHTNLFEPYTPQNPFESPDPFKTSMCNPKRLYLKPHAPGAEKTQQNDPCKATSTSEDAPPSYKDTGTGEGNVGCSKDCSVDPRSSDDTCSCQSTSSEDSVVEDKKKLRLSIDRAEKVTINVARLKNVSLANSSPDILQTKSRCSCKLNTRFVPDYEEDILDRGSTSPEIFEDDQDKETPLEETDYEEPREEKDVVNEEQDEPNDGQLAIKEEDKSEDASLSIKTEDPKDEPPHFETTVEFDLEPETVTTELYIVPQQKTVAEPTLKFVTEKHIDIADEPEQLKEVKTKDVEKQRTKETDKPPDSKTEQTEHKQEEEAPTKAQVDSKPQKVKTQVHIELIPRNLPRRKVSKDKATEEAPEKKNLFGVNLKKVLPSIKQPKTNADEDEKLGGQDSSDAPKNIFGVTPKKTGGPKEKPKISEHEDEQAKEGQESSEAPKNIFGVTLEKTKDIKQEPKDIVHEDEQAKEGQESSEAPKNIFEVTLKKTKDIKQEPKDIVHEDEQAKEGQESSETPKSIFGVTLKIPEEFKQEPKDIVHDDERTKEGQESSETPQSIFGATLKKPKEFREKSEATVNEDEHNSKKDEIKPENDGSYQKSKETKGVKTTPKDEQAKKGQESSDTHISYFTIGLKKKEKPKESSEGKNDNSNSKNKKQKNMQIISMMTRTEYDRGFGDFDEWIGVNKCIDQKTKKPQLIDYEDNNDRKHEKMFLKNHRTTDEKYVNGMARFPPLKRVKIPEDTLHQEETETDSLNTVNFHLKTENSIASSIYSAIETQLISFGSLLISILNFQDVVPSSSCKKSSSKHDISTSSKEKTVFDTKDDKESISRGNDSTSLPRNVHNDDSTSGGGFSHMHEVKQSIIVNKETEKYVLIGGSNSDQLHELSRNGFERPYHTRRTLVIRSRLKNPGRSRQQLQPPFRILKRNRKDKTKMK